LKKKSNLLIVPIIGFFIVFAVTSALAADDLSAAEVKKLFSGKTVEGINVNKGYSFKAYFDPEGTIRAAYPFGTRQGKWQVNKKGRKCVRWKDKKKQQCNIIARDDDVYKEFKIQKNGDRKHVATFKKFTDGNPSDL
jgi:hypothetical protein